jgi:hypothetical protein
MLISPRRTLNSWGNSSNRKSLRILPRGVIRGSALCVKHSASDASSCTIIVRNLNIVKMLPFRPNRFCLKSVGPGELTRTRIAISPSMGLNATTAAPARNRSRVLLANRYQVPDRRDTLTDFSFSMFIFACAYCLWRGKVRLMWHSQLRWTAGRLAARRSTTAIGKCAPTLNS